MIMCSYDYLWVTYIVHYVELGIIIFALLTLSKVELWWVQSELLVRALAWDEDRKQLSGTGISQVSTKVFGLIPLQK